MKVPSRRHYVRVVGVLALATCFALTLVVGSASAAKEIVGYFGTELKSGSLGGEFKSPGDIAVNQAGNGPADAGDIYVIDTGNQRIQRFDQEGSFVGAWGVDVSALGGGSSYEVCTVAAECKDGVESSIGGGVSFPSGIAVDQDSGNVYVADRGNKRISVYAGDGAFLRSFGWEVVASGPGNTGGYEVCVAANGDTCKAGDSGSGTGQIGEAHGIAVSQPDGSAATGAVFLADKGNNRIDTYGLDGSSPSTFGSPSEFGDEGPFNVALDSRGIVYAEEGDQPDQWRIARYDSENANGGGVGFLAPISIPPLFAGDGSQVNAGLEVDPDSDGAGPDSDVLFAMRGTSSASDSVIQQFGPLNEPGLTAAPIAADDVHGVSSRINFASGLGYNESSGRLFVSTQYEVGNSNSTVPGPNGVYVLDTPLPQPSVSLDSLSDITATSVTVHTTIDPNGPPDVGYHLEYSIDGSNWSRTGEKNAGSSDDPLSIDAPLDPPGGLEPKTSYHVRVVVRRPNYQPVVSGEETFITLASPPQAETTGSPLRTATTARLEGRVGPRNTATTYHFEYGAQGPCASNPCTATDVHLVGAGSVIRLVSQDVSELTPNTTYYYRVVAESSVPGSPIFGQDMTLTTRDSDASLEHGHFPGPPGSDRAYELVSAADTSGNPVILPYSVAISDNGDRATYGVAGGTSQSNTGSVFNQYFAQRTASGWKTEAIYPGRDELSGTNWLPAMGPGDLSRFVALNFNATGAFGRGVYRMEPETQGVKLFAAPVSDASTFLATSEDASVVVMSLRGDYDPDHPTVAGFNLYDVSSGSPKLISLLPGNTVPACGLEGSGSQTVFALPSTASPRAAKWVSADGSRVFFVSPGNACDSEPQLYVRELDAGQSKLISGPVLSGFKCGVDFIKSTPDAVFFWTQSRLDPVDSEPESCNLHDDGDIYRYEFDSEDVTCLTCVDAPGADILPLPANASFAVGADGSRVYFKSPNKLLPGAPTQGLYRLDVSSGDLAYVAPGQGMQGGEVPHLGSAINADGSVLVFASDNPDLNSVSGSDNHGILQYYRYDDRDRSLVCVSCMPDGSVGTPVSMKMQASEPIGPNSTPVSDAGDFVFRTADPLVAADQNTNAQEPIGGDDIYEWRDGRVLLITDGLHNWPSNNGSGVEPEIGGITPSGRDVFFIAPVQYTADALDTYSRYYDARIGGGFEIPPPPKPCPLEVCQGIPRGAPEEAAPGSASFAGPGNAKRARNRQSCPKGKRKLRQGSKVRCVKPKRKGSKTKTRKANAKRRAHR